jgi:hypothetical protein
VVIESIFSARHIVSTARRTIASSRRPDSRLPSRFQQRAQLVLRQLRHDLGIELRRAHPGQLVGVGVGVGLAFVGEPRPGTSQVSGT